MICSVRSTQSTLVVDGECARRDDARESDRNDPTDYVLAWTQLRVCGVMAIHMRETWDTCVPCSKPTNPGWVNCASGKETYIEKFSRSCLVSGFDGALAVVGVVVVAVWRLRFKRDDGGTVTVLCIFNGVVRIWAEWAEWAESERRREKRRERKRMRELGRSDAPSVTNIKAY